MVGAIVGGARVAEGRGVIVGISVAVANGSEVAVGGICGIGVACTEQAVKSNMGKSNILRILRL